MTAKATGQRAWAAAILAAAVAAAAVAACTTRQVEDVLHAGGKLAYDSMKARQQSQ